MKGGEQGQRLDPRRADLQRWREAFAQALREHGVDAVASSRLHRLQRDRAWNQTTREMNLRLAREHKLREPFHNTESREGGLDGKERAERAREAEKKVRRRYAEVTELLAQSEDSADRALAGAIADRFGLERPPPPPQEPRRAGRDNRAPPSAEQERQMPRARTGTDSLER